jgi:hypothetical protein
MSQTQTCDCDECQFHREQVNLCMVMGAFAVAAHHCGLEVGFASCGFLEDASPMEFACDLLTMILKTYADDLQPDLAAKYAFCLSACETEGVSYAYEIGAIAGRLFSTICLPPDDPDAIPHRCPESEWVACLHRYAHQMHADSASQISILANALFTSEEGFLDDDDLSVLSDRVLWDRGYGDFTPPRLPGDGNSQPEIPQG